MAKQLTEPSEQNDSPLSTQDAPNRVGTSGDTDNVAGGNIQVGSNVEGSIVVGSHAVKVNTHYGTIIHEAPGVPVIRLREVRPRPPRAPLDFVDRTVELAQLEQWIAAGEVVVICGPEGIGKSTLLRQAANSVAARALPDGVILIDGADEVSGSLTLGDFVQRLFDTFYHTEPPLKVTAATARPYLSQLRPLVLIDHVTLDANQLRPLTDLFPNSPILIARPDSLPGLARPLKLDPLPRAEAMALFAATCGLPIDAANRASGDAICALLSDVPLAVVRAADAVREMNLTLEQARARLETAPTVAGDSVALGLNRAMALIQSALTPLERQVLGVAANLPGSSADPQLIVAQLEGAQAADVEAAIEHLKALGLLHGQAPTETPARWNLAHPYGMPPNFTGRVEERAMLTQWLTADAHHPLLVIRALGGFGKTALAWHWLISDVNAAQWPRVVWWSFYEGDASFEHFISETLKYLRIEAASLGARQQVDVLLQNLQHSGTLLILDGFERQLRAFSSVNAAFQVDSTPSPAAPSQRGIEEGANDRDCISLNAEYFLHSLVSLSNLRGKVLITTRLLPRILHAPGGELRQGCLEIELAQMEPADAVEFFHAQGVRGSHAEIEAVCAQYGYHPLSLRLLAGLILRDLRQPGDIAVAERLDVSGDLIQRQHHVLQQAYDALPPARQKLLSRIACIRSPVSYEVLKALSGAQEHPPRETTGKSKRVRKSKQKAADGPAPVAQRSEALFDEDLRDLIARSLIYRDEGNQFGLHPTVRRYAYERLTPRERTAIHVQLRDYLASVSTPAEVQSLDDLTPTIELYHQTVRAGQFDEALAIFRDRIFRDAFYRFGAYALLIELLRELFPDGEDQLPRLKDQGDQARTLSTLANCYSISGQPRRAVSLLERLITIIEKQGDKKNLATSFCTVGTELLKIGALRAAEANLRRSVDLGEMIKDEHIEATGHQELGRLLAYCGRWAESERELATSTRHWETVDDMQKLCLNWSYRTLRALLMARMRPSPASKGASDEALLAARRSLELVDETARKSYPIEHDYINAHWMLGAAHRLNGDLAQAEQHLSEALIRCRKINNVENEANILLDLARLRADQSEREEAERLAQEALVITERSGYVLQGADVHVFLTQQALNDSDRAQALEYAREAYRLATCDGPPDYIYQVAYDEARQLLVELGDGPHASQAVPWGKCLAGLGMGNPQPLSPGQIKLIGDAKLEAFKILTLPDPDENRQLIAQLKKIRPDLFIVARLFFAADVNSRSKFSAQNFVDFCLNGLSSCYQAGVRYFEIHNEPNLNMEGMEWNWADGAQFGRWLMEVLDILKPRFPEAKWGYPGLSLQPNVDAFLEGSAAAAHACDWIGVHCYWQQPLNQPPFPMNGDNAGYYWRAKYRPRFPDKLLMITEFSNHSPAVSYEDKGRQYAEYYQMLRAEANVGAAFAFALSWPGQDSSKEAWENTPITKVVGERIGDSDFLDANIIAPPDSSWLNQPSSPADSVPLYVNLTTTQIDELRVGQAFNVVLRREKQETPTTQMLRVPKNAMELTLYIDAPGCAIDGDNPDTWTLTGERFRLPQVDYKPIGLRAIASGRWEIVVQLYAATADRVELRYSIDVAEPEQTPNIEELIDRRAIPEPLPDVILYVLLDQTEGREQLRYVVTCPALGYERKLLDPAPLTTIDLADLRRRARHAALEASFAAPPDALAALEACGKLLFNRLVTDTELHTVFAEIWRAALGRPWTMLVVSDAAATLPWELLFTHGVEEETDRPWRDTFWAQRFMLAHWIARKGLPLAAEAPYDQIDLAHYGQRPEDDLRRWQNILGGELVAIGHQLLTVVQPDSRSYGAHILLYDDAQRAGAIEEVTAGSQAAATDHSARSLVAKQHLDFSMHRPIVGLSFVADHAPSRHYPLSDVDMQLEADWIVPFAQTRATAIVGARWPVSSDADRIFYSAFYQALRVGVRLSRAVQRAREQVRLTLPDRADWLAYTHFGHPWCEPYQVEQAQGYVLFEVLNHSPSEDFEPRASYDFRASYRAEAPMWYPGRLSRFAPLAEGGELKATCILFPGKPQTESLRRLPGSNDYEAIFRITMPDNEPALTALVKFTHNERELQSIVLDFNIRAHGDAHG